MFSTKLHDTLAYTDGKNKMIWFRPSVGKTCPCTSVQHGTTETVSTYLNAFAFSAAVVSVRQRKISAKHGCSVTVALKTQICVTRLQCVKINLNEMRSENVDWIQVAQKSVQG